MEEDPVPFLTKERILQLCHISEAQWKQIRQTIEDLLERRPLPTAKLTAKRNIAVIRTYYLPLLTQAYEETLASCPKKPYSLNQLLLSSIRFVRKAVMRKASLSADQTQMFSSTLDQNVADTSIISRPAAVTTDGSHEIDKAMDEPRGKRKRHKKRKHAEWTFESIPLGSAGNDISNEIQDGSEKKKKTKKVKVKKQKSHHPTPQSPEASRGESNPKVDHKNKTKRRSRPSKARNVLDKSKPTPVVDLLNLADQQLPVSTERYPAVEGFIVADDQIPGENSVLSTWIRLDEIAPLDSGEPSFEDLMVGVQERLTGTLATARAGLIWHDKSDNSHMLVNSSPVLSFVISQSRSERLPVIRLSVKHVEVKQEKIRTIMQSIESPPLEADHSMQDYGEQANAARTPMTHREQDTAPPTIARFDITSPQRSREDWASAPESHVNHDIERGGGYEPDYNFENTEIRYDHTFDGSRAPRAEVAETPRIYTSGRRQGHNMARYHHPTMRHQPVYSGGHQYSNNYR